MADTLSSLSVVAYVLAGLLFVGAIVLFIVLKIPKVIDYFTNRSAKRSVKKMVSTGGASFKNATFQTSSVNRNRGKITEPVSVPNPQKYFGDSVKSRRPETGLLNDSKEVPYILKPTADLAGKTELLDENGTNVLSETIENVATSRPHMELTILDEVVLIHTDEVIP